MLPSGGWASDLLDAGEDLSVGSGTTVSLDSNGIPHMCYFEEKHIGYDLYYANKLNDHWEKVKLVEGMEGSRVGLIF